MQQRISITKYLSRSKLIHATPIRRQSTLTPVAVCDRSTKMAQKRKAPASVGYSDSVGEASNKRSALSKPEQSIKSEDEDHKSQFDHSRPEERNGIVQREFYPAEMSNERCAAYNNNEIPRPIEVLQDAIRTTEKAREALEAGECVVHWFKRDLRIYDNTSLSRAAALAKNNGIPLICMFIVSPQDYQAHFTSSCRVDFELRTLAVLQQDLAALDIPLYTETVHKRKAIPDHIINLAKKWGAKHVYTNIEYEVDELRREALLTERCLENGINFTAVHDDVVVAPGQLSSGTGRQYAVYSPWFRAWIAHIQRHEGLLSCPGLPDKNPSSVHTRFKFLFDSEIPQAPANKSLKPEEKKRFEHLWPAGEHEARERLQKFLVSRANKYKDMRNFPAEDNTAKLSVHLSVGTLAARTCVREAQMTNNKKLDGGSAGIACWISEVAWRDFYKHVLAHWPYVCMFKPFKYEYTNVEWEYSDEHFARWCKGTTGYPIVDAAMRQMKHMGYMHNRCRMITASFLAKHLLLDWRLGEKFFMESLIDGDFASNNGGWGFSASTGVDPQPYFRIFNPYLQSEKFDERGDYIRRWIPELSDIKGKAIHDPHNRGASKQAAAAGYPKPIVEHKQSRERALARYKAGIGRNTA